MMNTTENNKLIAEFMGLKTIAELEGVTKSNKHLKNCFFLPETNLVYLEPEYLRYGESWDWLMPVVEKITQQTEKFKEGHIDSCLYTPLASALIRFTDKELVYEAVVEFIKWYNENK